MTVLSAPEDTGDAAYRPAIKQISTHLQTDYAQHYLIMNVSEPRTDLIRLNTNVMDYGWPATLAPPLEKLCAVCKQADVWINADPRNILVVHCKGGLGRAAIVVASYMHYTSICATPSQALDRYAMKRFFDEELKKHILPSQRRFVQYFSGLLNGSIRICGDPMYLQSITLLQVANFDGKAGCRPQLKISQANDHLWTSDVYSMSEAEGRRILSIQLRPPLQLRGDILIKCHHQKKMRSSLKDVIFRCQLHTCAIPEGTLFLNKADLDEANNDIRFPEDGRLELTFSRSRHPLLTGEQGEESTSPARSSLPEPPVSASLFQQEEEEDLNDPSPYAHRADGLWNNSSIGYSRPTDPADVHLIPARDYSDYPISTPPAPSTDSYQDLASQATYAVISKKHPAQNTAGLKRTFFQEEENSTGEAKSSYNNSRDAPLLARKDKDDLLSGSFDSGISGAVQLPQSGSYSAKMDIRRELQGAASPVAAAGTLKSVKFHQDSLSRGQNENLRPSLRNGMDVVDLDVFQPDMEELDRVFESLQAQTEDLERQQRNLDSKPATKSLNSANPPPLAKVTPLRTLNRSPSIENGDHRNGTQSPSVPAQEGLISGYVPQDRKGLGKKYGAFTFGLPTGKPELKPISSPPPVRRSNSASGDEQNEDMYGRSRLRHVQEGGSAAEKKERARAEERLYNSSAPSDAPGRNINNLPARDRQQEDSVGGAPERNRSRSEYGSSSLDRSTYARITPKSPVQSNVNATRDRQQQQQQQQQRHFSPVSTVPRPKTPTEEERLQRLLSVEEREFLIEEPDEKIKGRLREIGREDEFAQPPQQQRQARSPSPSPPVRPYFPVSAPAPSYSRGKPSTTDMSIQASPDVNMESEYIQTDPEDSPLPERKKKKKQQQSAQQQTDHARLDAPAWLQMQHDKLMSRKYGPDYVRKKSKEAAMLEELRSSQERMIQQVPNREEDENRLPLSSIILREAKTPPLTRSSPDQEMFDRRSGMNSSSGYAVVRSRVSQQRQSSTGTASVPMGSGQLRRLTSTDTRDQADSRVNQQSQNQQFSAAPPPRTGTGNGQFRQYSGGSTDPDGTKRTWTVSSLRTTEVNTDTDHDSIADEIEFNDEPLYKSPGSYRQSRSREIDESRVGQVQDGNRGAVSNPTSPDVLRKTAASPKSILKNASLQRSRNATSEDRSSTIHSLDRPITPSFPLPANDRGGSLDRQNRLHTQNSSLQRGYSLYGTRERTVAGSGRSTPTGYFGMSNSRRSSLTSLSNTNLNDQDEFVIHHHPIFVRDLSKFWYKPAITREEAIQILKDKPAGTFLIRDSNSFPGAFGLALKVDADQLAASQDGHGRSTGGSNEELVRHFLIEPSPKGVHLKGCQNEPIFGSLPALVYQHSITPLALPCKLLLPDSDLTLSHQPVYSEDNLQKLMEQGAACNVFYLLTVDTESLTGPQAIRRAMIHVNQGHTVRPTIVHFKVNSQGIILTDSKRKIFFRRHYPIQAVSFCGLDPDDRRWSFKMDENSPVVSARCFGFVSRKRGTRNQNECHVFAELEAEQPAAAVVSFVTKVMMTANAPHDGTLRSLPASSLDSSSFSRR